MEQSKPKNKKPRVFQRWLLFFCFFLPTAYILLQLFLVLLNKPYTTQTAIQYTIPDKITAKAFIDMPQEAVAYNGGVARYLVDNGERVSINTPLAEVFEGEAQAASREEAQRLEREIARLQEAQRAGQGVNIDTLLEQKLTKTYYLTEQLATGDFLTISEVRSDLQMTVNKLQIATKETSDFNARIETLQASYAAANAAAGASTLVSAPASGYFANAESGALPQYSSEQLAAMSPLEMKQAQAADTAGTSGILGRMIYDYRWNCYLSVNLKQAERFIEGKNVQLTLGQGEQDRIPAQIVKVETDAANDAAKITISCDYMNGTILAANSAVASVIFGDYTGLRLDKAALRLVDGMPGVYVKYGNVIEYRKISVLFEDENYILVPLVYEQSVNELRRYDEVITGGRNISDGKTL